MYTNSLTPGHVYTKRFCLRFGCVLLSRGLMYKRAHTHTFGCCKILNTHTHTPALTHVRPNRRFLQKKKKKVN